MVANLDNVKYGVDGNYKLLSNYVFFTFITFLATTRQYRDSKRACSNESQEGYRFSQFLHVVVHCLHKTFQSFQCSGAFETSFAPGNITIKLLV